MSHDAVMMQLDLYVHHFPQLPDAPTTPMAERTDMMNPPPFHTLLRLRNTPHWFTLADKGPEMRPATIEEMAAVQDKENEVSRLQLCTSTVIYKHQCMDDNVGKPSM